MLKQHINIAVDVILFTIIDEKAHVLLIKRKFPPFLHVYAFPGGFVQDFETLEEAALRELSEETDIKNANIEVLDIYDDLDRDPRARVISIAFIGVIDFERIDHLRASSDALIAEWVQINEVKELAFDHNLMFQDALKFLSSIQNIQN
jgi:8-oxo-dGTP diphosphatase